MGKAKKITTVMILLIVCFVLMGGTSSFAVSTYDATEAPQKEVASPWAWLEAVLSFTSVFQMEEQAEPTATASLLQEMIPADPVTLLMPDDILSGTVVATEETQEAATGEITAGTLEEGESALVPEETEQTGGQEVPEEVTDGEADVAEQLPPDAVPQDPVLDAAQEQDGIVAEATEPIAALFDPMAVMVPFVARNFTFAVTDDSITAAPVSGATIQVTAGGSTQTGTTNASGQVTLALNDDSNISYTFSKTGYSDVSGVLTSTDSDQVGVTMKKLHNVTFTVTDGSVPIPGAKVLFNGAEKTTGADGKAVFNANNGSYTYEASHPNITNPVTGSVTVDNSSKDVAVMLVGGNRVDFIVKDDAGVAVAGATVTIDGTPPKLTTDANGVARTWLVSGQLYEYTAEHPEHQVKTGSINVNAGTNQVEVSLSRNRYNVIFVVKDTAGNLLSGATVTVDGRSATTGAEGKVVVSFLKTGAYDVTVQKDGYETYRTTVDVNRSTPEFEVSMTAATVTPTPTPAKTPAPTSKPSSSNSGSGSKSGSKTSSKGSYGSGGSSYYSGGDEEDPEASVTPSPTPSPMPTPSANPTPAPSAEPEEEPTLSLGFCLMDADWNPVEDAVVELHSEPQRERTDSSGVVFFLNVEYGSHNLYVMDDNGDVIAQKSFELVESDALDLEPTSGGTDKLFISDKSSTVAVDVLLDGNKLSMVKLHEEDPREALTEEEKQEAAEDNSNLLILLAVCIACLIVALAIVFAATKLIKKTGKRHGGQEERSLPN